MPGTKLVFYVSVITVALVHVMNKQSDRRAGGSALENARENLDLVGLLALRRVARCSGAPAFQIRVGRCLRAWIPRPCALVDGRPRLGFPVNELEGPNKGWKS